MSIEKKSYMHAFLFLKIKFAPYANFLWGFERKNRLFFFRHSQKEKSSFFLPRGVYNTIQILKGFFEDAKFIANNIFFDFRVYIKFLKQ